MTKEIRLYKNLLNKWKTKLEELEIELEIIQGIKGNFATQEFINLEIKTRLNFNIGIKTDIEFLEETIELRTKEYNSTSGDMKYKDYPNTPTKEQIESVRDRFGDTALFDRLVKANKNYKESLTNESN